MTKSRAKQSENLAKLVEWQLIGFMVLEVVIVLLLLVGLIPPFLTIYHNATYNVVVNTGVLVIVTLIILLTSSLWIAALAEILDMVEVKNI